jgi:putative phosphoesterase
MKFFFISDIHGNQYALEAILLKAKEVKSDRIICLGDVSGYFTGINEVIHLLKLFQVETIKGNHDEFLFQPSIIDIQKKYFPAYENTRQIIGEKEFEWLKNLKNQLKIQIGDNSYMHIVHGGTNDLLNEYVFPDQIDINKYSNYESNIFLFGHTHLQFVKKIENKIFANPGSVGLPRNGDFRAHGISFDTQENLFVEYKIPYDLNLFNSVYSKDSSIYKGYFHNVNFGRSSNKPLISDDKEFLDDKSFSLLTLNNISIINTKFGAILSTDPLFLNNLIYIAAYEDNTIEVSSNTLIFNWKIEDNIKFYNNIREDKDFKKNSAGIYYFKLYPTFEYFKTNILEIISIAFKKTNNYVNK